MINTQVINIRVDKNIKQQAQKIVSKLGLDVSSAVKLFLNQVIITESIPFKISTRGRMYDPKFVKQLKEEIEWASKHGKKYSSAKEMIDDILS